jgi:hypothetical protein
MAENTLLFLRTIESSVPFPLNNDYDIELSDEQKDFIKHQHLVFPTNTTLMMVSLDRLAENFVLDKSKPMDSTIEDITAGLHMDKEEREYLISKLVQRIMTA